MNENVTAIETNDSSMECMRTVAMDRRVNTWRTAFYSLFSRRRASQRRQDDLGRAHYVDIHEASLFFLAIVALLLCVADAFFTMTLLDHFGSSEMNPVMDILIKKDYHRFFFVKFGLTAGGIIFLVAHKNFRVLNLVSGYHILLGCVLLYSVLTAYEVFLLVISPNL